MIGGLAERFVVDEHQSVGANHDGIGPHDSNCFGLELGIEFAQLPGRHRCIMHFLGRRGDNLEFDSRAAEQFLAARG